MSRGDGHRTLQRPVRGAAIGAQLGDIYLVVGALMAPPALVALLLRDGRLGGIAAGIALGLGLLGWLLGRIERPKDLHANEAMTTTALVFVTVPLAMTPVFLAAGLGPLDATFEAYAVVTTAGLSMLPSVEQLSPAVQFARAWMQWFGGLGFIGLSVALIAGPGVIARRIAAEFDRDLSHAGGTHARGRRILWIYGGLTVAGFVLLWLTTGDPFLALLHALTAVATGGYSTFDAGPSGLGAFGAQIVVLVLCILGATSFDLHGRTHRRRWRHYLTDRGLRAMLAAIALITVLLILLEGGWSLGDFWRSLNLAVMAQTTAGFSTTPLGALDPAAQLVLAIAMLTGGDVGSTAGGIKLLRVLITLRLLQLVVARTALPQHAVVLPRIEGRRIGDAETMALLAFLAGLGLLVLLSWLAFAAAGHPAFPAFLEVVAAVSTSGLSTGITGPDLAWHLKLVLIFDMLAGRLEVIALVVLLYPATWIGGRRRAA